MKSALQVVVKPALHCSLGCSHCYHSPEEMSSSEVLSDERLEKMFRLTSAEYESVWFIWHGGEPTELPFSFWKKAISLQEEYFGAHRVTNTLQTNGFGLDRRLVDFCRKKKINIGISNEGPCTHLRPLGNVDKIIRKLSQGERVFSVSSTIDKKNEPKQSEIYRYFEEIGTAVSFSPVAPIGNAKNRIDLIPDTDEYIKHSIELFDLWLKDKDAKVPLSPHYFYILSALGNPQPSDCAHSSCLTKWISIYPNGDLYPCGKSCPESMRLGNIDNCERIEDAFRTEGFEELLRKSIARREKCSNCEVYRYCQGGCSLDAYWEKSIEEQGNPSCIIFKEVFTHIKNELDDIIKEERDISQYNKFVRDAIVGKLTNPVFSMQ